MQAQHLPHHPHAPPIPLTPHPSGLQPPISAAGAPSFLAGAFPPGFPGIPPHLAALKESIEKGELLNDSPIFVCVHSFMKGLFIVFSHLDNMTYKVCY